MSLTRRTPQGGDSTPIDNLDEREYEGRLVMVADLGMQEGMEWKGKQKPDAQQISLGIEILGETVTIDDVEKPRILWTKPFNIFSNLTEKGNELKYYKTFNPSAEDGDTPDWDAQLGKPCSVLNKHNSGTGENSSNTYDNIHSLVAVPAKYQDGVPPATVEFGIGDADDEGNAVNKMLFGLPRFVFEKRLGQPEKAAESAKEEEDDIPY